MSRVKGKYVAIVTIEWDQEREPNMRQKHISFVTAILTIQKGRRNGNRFPKPEWCE